jgi:hypothetical protein
MRRALEHHVLEEMSEAAAALRFQTEAYFVINAYGDNWGGGIWCDDDLKAISKRGRFDRYIHCGSSLNPAKSGVLFV